MSSAISELRPSRRTLLGQWLVDLLISIVVSLPFAIPGLIERNTAVHHLVERVDVWQFDSMPANHDSLHDWGSRQHDLQCFRVDRLAQDQIVLRYVRDRRQGASAAPDWRALGYVTPRLLSTDSSALQDPDVPRSGWGWSWEFAGSVAALAVLFPRLNRAWRPNAPWNFPPARSWQLVILVLLASGAFRMGLRWLQGDVSPQTPVQRILPQLQGWASFMAWCTVAMVGPALEEVLFRGCLFGRFRLNGYPASGAVLSAFAFSVAHRVPVLMPHYFVNGLVLAWVCHRTRSLWPPLAVHIGWNVLALVIAVWTYV
jgi:membrane protease YdiL (CAAX protease family)